MRLLLDTSILLWTSEDSARLSVAARHWVTDSSNTLVFSAISIAEIAIKNALGRADFETDPQNFREGLLETGYVELPLTSAHAVMVGGLPPIHKDPFDRMLIAQAMAEGITLLTSDKTVARYPGPVRLV